MTHFCRGWGAAQFLMQGECACSGSRPLSPPTKLKVYKYFLYVHVYCVESSMIASFNDMNVDSAQAIKVHNDRQQNRPIKRAYKPTLIGSRHIWLQYHSPSYPSTFLTSLLVVLLSVKQVTSSQLAYSCDGRGRSCGPK